LKICTKCNEAKELTEFHKKASAQDGHKPRCKTCVRSDSKNSKVINARKRKARTNNSERTKANKKRDYEKHKEKRNATTRAWYHNNKEKQSIKQKIRRAGERGRDLRDKHAQLRALRIRETTDGSITVVSKQELYIAQEAKCYLCECDLTQLKKRNVHLDHIISLSKGGKHIIENVAWSCGTCNLTKGAS